MLAYSGIAQAGYILVGLAAGTSAGASGTLFYLLAYALTTVTAFGVLIGAGRLAVGPSGGETLEDLTGLAGRRPGLAAAMALCMFSLTGLPPLVGFLGKLYVFGAAVQAGLTWLAIVGVINSVVSAYYYLHIVAVMYSKGSEATSGVKGSVCPALAAGVGLACVAIAVLSLWPEPFINLALASVQALLGG
jgi:NADH-quinone oxidoreductase subunit N